MLNIFVHDVKVNLVQYSVRGDKTNEPGCLKAHAAELFAQYPLLKLLTGDAIFLQRPLIEVLREHGCDYLFQVYGNQKDTLEAVKCCFQNAPEMEPDDVTLEKKWLCRCSETLVRRRKRRLVAGGVRTYRLSHCFSMGPRSVARQDVAFS